MEARSLPGRDKTRTTVPLSSLVAILPLNITVDICANASEPPCACSILACHLSTGSTGCGQPFRRQPATTIRRSNIYLTLEFNICMGPYNDQQLGLSGSSVFNGSSLS
jgi:hypothetical protein